MINTEPHSRYLSKGGIKGLLLNSAGKTLQDTSFDTFYEETPLLSGRPHHHLNRLPELNSGAGVRVNKKGLYIES